jgi:hypothetical protein
MSTYRSWIGSPDCGWPPVWLSVRRLLASRALTAVKVDVLDQPGTCTSNGEYRRELAAHPCRGAGLRELAAGRRPAALRATSMPRFRVISIASIAGGVFVWFDRVSDASATSCQPSVSSTCVTWSTAIECLRCGLRIMAPVGVLSHLSTARPSRLVGSSQSSGSSPRRAAAVLGDESGA